MAAPRSRVVLDTNVCLDLLVFADPRCAALEADLARGLIEPVTDAACRAEWLAVLRYPALALDEPTQRRALAMFDARVRLVAEDAVLPAPRLPRRADPDDQKFMLLAAGVGARWLLSRDRALLALAPRLHRDGRFGILTPQAWAAATRAPEHDGRGRLDVRIDQADGSAGSLTSSVKPV